MVCELGWWVIGVGCRVVDLGPFRGRSQENAIQLLQALLGRGAVDATRHLGNPFGANS